MKVVRQDPAPPEQQELKLRLFSGAFGAFLGLALLKFGNPPIMEKWVEKPEGLIEIVLAFPWPIVWGYALLALVGLLGVSVGRLKTAAPRWLIALPLAWLAWQTVAAMQAVDGVLATATLKHLVACVVCFYLGLFSLGRVVRHGAFWLPLVCGFLLVIVQGWEQNFGGLEETRRFFFLNVSQLSGPDITGLPSLAAKLAGRVDPLSAYLWSQLDQAGRDAVANVPEWPGARDQAREVLAKSLNGVITNGAIYSTDRFRDVRLRPETQRLLAANPTAAEAYRLNRLLLEDAYPGDLAKMPDAAPELLKRMSSKRIFSTLLYPNTLAGCLLLLLPPVLAVTWAARERFTIGARRFLVAAIAAGALGCLYWSGSKGGWLLMMLLGLLALLELPFSKKLKTALVVVVCVAGLAGFFWKYASFFQRGAKSVSARLDYWRAAAQITVEHPLFGTGPGTFLIPYEKLKRPESETTRLVHNDYLEQASDSGLPGAAAYTLFIGAGLARTFPRRRKTETGADGPPAPGGGKARQERDWIGYSVWLGLLGWSLQSLLEFGLYIPALAWTAFALLGWMLAGKTDGGRKVPTLEKQL